MYHCEWERKRDLFVEKYNYTSSIFDWYFCSPIICTDVKKEVHRIPMWKYAILRILRGQMRQYLVWKSAGACAVERKIENIQSSLELEFKKTDIGQTIFKLRGRNERMKKFF